MMSVNDCYRAKQSFLHTDNHLRAVFLLGNYRPI